MEMNAKFVSSSSWNLLQKKHRNKSLRSISSTASTPLTNGEWIKVKNPKRPPIKAFEDSDQKIQQPPAATSYVKTVHFVFYY